MRILIHTDFGPIGYSLSSCGICSFPRIMIFHCVQSYLHIGTFKTGLYCESSKHYGQQQ